MTQIRAWGIRNIVTGKLRAHFSTNKLALERMIANQQTSRVNKFPNTYQLQEVEIIPLIKRKKKT